MIYELIAWESDIFIRGKSLGAGIFVREKTSCMCRTSRD
jgi:hypothetical protein